MACYRFTCAFSDLSCFLVMPPALRLLWSRLTSWLNPFSFTMGRTTEWSWGPNWHLPWPSDGATWLDDGCSCDSCSETTAEENSAHSPRTVQQLICKHGQGITSKAQSGLHRFHGRSGDQQRWIPLNHCCIDCSMTTSNPNRQRQTHFRHLSVPIAKLE